MRTQDCIELTGSAVSGRSGHSIQGGFLSRVLTPYRENCRYLRAAELETSNAGYPHNLQMHGDFAIGESCYIDDTGHFNAVEFNICYNQIAYTHLGYCIEQGLLPELANFGNGVFYHKQLSNFLIASISSSYAKELNPRRFRGTFGIRLIRRRRNCTFIKTECRFSDFEAGASEGEVTLAVLDP